MVADIPVVRGGERKGERMRAGGVRGGIGVTVLYFIRENGKTRALTTALIWE